MRKVFYSFHYANDAWRTSQVRNIRAIEGNKPVSDNDWEQVKRGGDEAIKRWINEQMRGRSCAIVLIGSETAQRKWVQYEIDRAWKNGMGVVGIYIHGLKDQNELTSSKGVNPFELLTVGGVEKMSNIVRAYDPRGTSSRERYAYISDNIENWVEEAIKNWNSFG